MLTKTQTNMYKITTETVQYAFSNILETDIPIFTVEENLTTGIYKIESEELRDWLTLPTKMTKHIRSMRIISGKQEYFDDDTMGIMFYYKMVTEQKKKSLQFTKEKLCTIFFTKTGEYESRVLFEFTPNDGSELIQPGKVFNNHQILRKPGIRKKQQLITRRGTKEYILTFNN